MYTVLGQAGLTSSLPSGPTTGAMNWKAGLSSSGSAPKPPRDTRKFLASLIRSSGAIAKPAQRRVYGMRTAHGAECARRVHGMRTARRLPLDASSAASSRNIGSSSTLSSTRTTEAQAAPRRAKRLPHARGVACCVRACGATYPLLSEISTRIMAGRRRSRQQGASCHAKPPTTRAKPLPKHRPTATQAATRSRSLLSRSRVSRAVERGDWTLL